MILLNSFSYLHIKLTSLLLLVSSINLPAQHNEPKKNLGDIFLISELVNMYDWECKYSKDSIKMCGEEKCNGMIRKSYQNGKLKHIAKYKNGFPVYDLKLNLVQDFYLSENGDTLISFKVLNIESKTYIQKEWFSNGNIKAVGKQKLISTLRVKKIGVWKYYDKNGNFIKVEKY